MFHVFVLIKYNGTINVIRLFVEIKNTQIIEVDSRFSGIKKPPTTSSQGFKIGVDLLSHPQKDSTISASRLNFSVRDGKRWTLLL